MVSPFLAPVFADIIYQYRGWRWIHWTMVILSLVSTAMMASVKETYDPKILSQRSLLAKKEDTRYWSKYDDFGQGSIFAKLEVSLKRPIKMAFKEPIW